MARLGNPLVYDLLVVADMLAEQRGRRNLQKAAIRRAISSAYYAVFHGLCFVCTRALERFTIAPQSRSFSRCLILLHFLRRTGIHFVGKCSSLWRRDPALTEPVYRLLDHGQIRRRLAGREASELGPIVVEISAAFAYLQDRRHQADYSPPGLTIHRDATRNVVARAKQAVTDLESLDDDQCRRLAVLPITKARLA
ncbi:hypothetical protein ACQVP2_05045 [Methylobacterium aquaticum]|uniref:hypothetical protein n=1 Tax=Methylobacterium aquaticum TaxID=270351 RepID=UPI003D184D4A